MGCHNRSFDHEKKLLINTNLPWYLGITINTLIIDYNTNPIPLVLNTPFYDSIPNKKRKTFHPLHPPWCRQVVFDTGKSIPVNIPFWMPLNTTIHPMKWLCLQIVYPHFQWLKSVSSPCVEMILNGHYIAIPCYTPCYALHSPMAKMRIANRHPPHSEGRCPPHGWRVLSPWSSLVRKM